MVEVFKTDVQETEEADQLVALLQEHFPGSRINFDLHDCDKILRIEGKHCIPSQVEVLVQQNGYSCNVLE
jgi:hypothetical protein